MIASYPAIITSREVIIAGALIFKMAVYRFVGVSEEKVNTALKMQLSPGLTLFEGKI